MTDSTDSYETHTALNESWITVRLTVAEWNMIRRLRKK